VTTDYDPCQFFAHDDGLCSITFSGFEEFMDHIEAQHGQAGGYSWEAMIKAVAAMRGITIPEESFDPESGMFAAASRDRTLLKTIAGIIRDLAADRTLMDRAIADAKKGKYWN